MFTNEDLHKLLNEHEEARQQRLRDAGKVPVWLTKIQFGNATAYRLESGSRIMGEKVAFYAYKRPDEIYNNAEELLRDALSAGFSQNPHIIDRRGGADGIIALLDIDNLADYGRYLERRQLLVLAVIMQKMGVF